MLPKFRSAVNSVIAAARQKDMSEGRPPAPPKPERFPYSRPSFLGLTEDEVQGSRDFGIRPILIPRDIDKLPWSAGYAEALNGGKSDFNEDQAAACHLVLKPRWQQELLDTWRHGPINRQAKPVPLTVVTSEDMMQTETATYFGVFDGHAGYGAAISAANLLHKHIQEKLEACLQVILLKSGKSEAQGCVQEIDPDNNISVDQLVTGALEEAFSEMDNQMERDKSRFLLKGGCTALVVLFFNGKLYVANAGDCRAVLCHGDEVRPMSTDFTAESERVRLNYFGHTHPDLLHNEFTCLEFQRRVNKNDMGKRILCRYPGNVGWTVKTATEDDLKFPLIISHGKRARVMGTIGVTRGFGDHDLVVFDSDIRIKPFLSSTPEVQVLDLSEGEWTEDDFLIMGSDGLWDTISNETAVNIARKAMSETNKFEQNRYTIAAQELVLEGRGLFTGRGWKKKNEEAASFDDLTVFVIPLKPYCDQLHQGPRHKSSEGS